jgi:hypothetical protein
MCLILLGALNQNIPYLKLFVQELFHNLVTAEHAMAKSQLQPYFNLLVSGPKRMRTLLKIAKEYKQVIIHVFLSLMLIKKKFLAKVLLNLDWF